MQIFAESLVVVFVVSIMFGVGLTLTSREILASLDDRKLLLKALLGNFILLPLLALGVARLFDLNPLLSAGLLVLATAPGGPVLIKLALLAKADPAHAVGLLVCLLLVGIISQPLLLPLLLQGVVVSSGEIVLTLLLTVLLPLLLGLGLRAVHLRVADRLASVMQRLSTLSMLLLWFVLPIHHWDALQQMPLASTLPAALVFLLLAALAGWLLGGPHAGSRRLLSLSCSQPNLAAAMMIATHNFSDPPVVLMLLMILLVSIPLMLSLALFYRRQALAA
jgi:BASS family bile acid:Na+ symporter